jgi:hypothetical protein
MNSRTIVHKLLEGWEAAGEIAPGSAPHVRAAFGSAPGDGDPAEAVARLVAHVYGAPAVDLGSGPVAASPPSPYMSRSAPSARLDPAAAAAARLAPLLAGRRGAEWLARDHVDVVEAGGGPGDVAGRMFRRLWNDPDEHGRLKADVAPAPSRSELIANEVSDRLVALRALDASERDSFARDLRTSGESMRGWHSAARAAVARLQDNAWRWPSAVRPTLQPADLGDDPTAPAPDAAGVEATADELAGAGLDY